MSTAPKGRNRLSETSLTADTKGHRWSGWPGAYCLDCGVEDALENALADNWFDPITNVWKSDLHRELVELCNGNCAAKMPVEEFKQVRERCREIGALLKEGGS